VGVAVKVAKSLLIGAKRWTGMMLLLTNSVTRCASLRPPRHGNGAVASDNGVDLCNIGIPYAANLWRAAPLMIAAPFSAIIIVGAFVLVEVTAGMTEASMTLSPSIP